MKKSTLILTVLMLCTPNLHASIITSNASDFFLNLASQPDPEQSASNEWQIGRFNGSAFELFNYSGSTVLGRTSIVGWIQDEFYGAFLNTGPNDESFPGNVFKAGALNLHPGQNGAEIVLRHIVQQNSIYSIAASFFALDTIESPNRNSDGVNVSVRINGNQFNDTRDIVGFGNTTTHQISGSGLALIKGDFIDFIVMPKSNFYDDATIVSASVSRSSANTVDEPQVFVLLLLGMLSVVLRRLR